MQIAGYNAIYNFEQPYILRLTNFPDVPAVYVVYTVLNGKTIWLDVGEAGKLGNRIANHDRKNCWLNHAIGSEIYIGFKQEGDEFTRRQIEVDLRNRILPLCGDR